MWIQNDFFTSYCFRLDKFETTYSFRYLYPDGFYLFILFFVIFWARHRARFTFECIVHACEAFFGYIHPRARPFTRAVPDIRRMPPLLSWPGRE